MLCSAQKPLWCTMVLVMNSLNFIQVNKQYWWQTSADMIPWWQWMLSAVWLKPLLASMNTPSSVIPTVSIRDCFGGFSVGINTEFIGLSDIPLPTCSLCRTTEMLCFVSSLLGPMPLINNSWGLPIAPAETITSLRLFWMRKACWSPPFSSLNWTPIALGRCPVQRWEEIVCLVLVTRLLSGCRD